MIPAVDDLRLAVLRVIEQAADEGSPVAGKTVTDAAQQVDLALRRTRSFDRRARGGKASYERRVEDLAKGLRDHNEVDSALVGPLMEDYRWLARRIVDALVDDDSD